MAVAGARKCRRLISLMQKDFLVVPYADPFEARLR